MTDYIAPFYTIAFLGKPYLIPPCLQSERPRAKCELDARRLPLLSLQEAGHKPPRYGSKQARDNFLVLLIRQSH